MKEYKRSAHSKEYGSGKMSAMFLKGLQAGYVLQWHKKRMQLHTTHFIYYLLIHCDVLRCKTTIC